MAPVGEDGLLPPDPDLDPVLLVSWGFTTRKITGSTTARMTTMISRIPATIIILLRVQNDECERAGASESSCGDAAGTLPENEAFVDGGEDAGMAMTFSSKDLYGRRAGKV